MDDLGLCQVCQIERAEHLMYKKFTDDKQDTSTLAPVPACHDCAMDLFESGDYESDEN